MAEAKKNKPDQELRKELLELIDAISADSVKQPANRSEEGFWESKHQFTSRGRSEKEHLSWYDRRRHSDMKSELLMMFNERNPDREIGFIEDVRKATERPGATYPHISWIALTCHAAVAAVRKLHETDQQKMGIDYTTRGVSNDNPVNPSLSLEGPVLTLEQIAEQLQNEKPGNTLATTRDSLQKLCRTRKREMNEKGLKGAQPLYKNGDIMRDIYIIETEGRYLFQRMVRR